MNYKPKFGIYLSVLLAISMTSLVIYLSHTYLEVTGTEINNVSQSYIEEQLKKYTLI